MHFVDRGQKPSELESLQIKFTPRWKEFYLHGKGRKPGDSYWRKFKSDLEHAFSGLCVCCESICSGEVEHFRPKSRYPDLVYEWSNLLFACRECNLAKSNKWPVGGYFDPCAVSQNERPELVFGFESMTCEIVPLKDLGSVSRKKAQRMIDDLKLNDHHHLKKRKRWLVLIEQLITCASSKSRSKMLDDCGMFVARDAEFSSLVRWRLTELGIWAEP